MIEDILNSQLFPMDRNNIINIHKLSAQRFLKKGNRKKEGLLTENYFINKIKQSNFVYSTNWWSIKNYSKIYLINIAYDTISDIDLAFAKEMIINNKADRIIHICYSPFKRKLTFYMPDIEEIKQLELGTSYNEEDIAEILNIKPKNEIEENEKIDIDDEITNSNDDILFNWFSHNIDEQKFLYEEIILDNFISKYFYSIHNIDILLYDNISQKFYIAEVKRKTITKDSNFIINVGEFDKLTNFNCDTIQTVFLAMIVKGSKNVPKFLNSLITNQDINIYYFSPNMEKIQEIKSERYIIYGDGDYQSTTKYVYKFPFKYFKKIDNLSNITQTNGLQQINDKLRLISLKSTKSMQDIGQIGFLDNDNKEFDYIRLKIAQISILLWLETLGYDINNKTIDNLSQRYNKKIVINGKTILFKSIQSVQGRCLRFTGKDEYAELYNDVDYVLAYRIKPQYNNREIINYKHKEFNDEIYREYYLNFINDEFPYEIFIVSKDRLIKNLIPMEMSTDFSLRACNNAIWNQSKNKMIYKIDDLDINAERFMFVTTSKANIDKKQYFALEIPIFIQVDLENRKIIYPPNEYKKFDIIKAGKYENRLDIAKQEEKERLKTEYFVPFAEDLLSKENT